MENLPTPLSRVELYLAKACGMDVTVPEQPLSRLEQFLAILAGDTSITMPTPMSLTEQWLAYVLGVTPDPLLAVEGACLIGAQKVDVRYFAVAASMPGATLPEAPQNRAEMYWAHIAGNPPTPGILKYVTGKYFYLTDVVSGIDELQYVKGDTYQQTYSGKNLSSSTVIIGGWASQGTPIINGARFKSQDKIIVLPQTTYTFSGIPKDASKTLNITIQNYDSNDTIISQLPSSNTFADVPFTFTTPADCTKITFSGRYSDNTNFGTVGQPTDAIQEVQIEAGSPATSYEPYVGGIPAPNPDYPQDVQTVTGEQTVTVSDGANTQSYPISLTGKNLFNVSATPTYTNGVSVAGSLTVTATSSGTSKYALYRLVEAKNYVGSKICVSCSTMHPSSTNDARIEIGLCNADGTSKTSKAYTNNVNLKPSFTVTDDPSKPYIYIALYASYSSSASVGDYVGYGNVMVNRGSTPGAYASYSPIELCKIGDYQDYIYKSGDGWYVHKEFGKYVFNGSETIAYNSSNKGFTINPTNLANYMPNHATPPMVGLSTHFSVNSTTSTWTGDNRIGLSSAGTFWCKATSFATSESDCHTWLTANTPSVYYALATASDTKITDATLISQLDALNSATLPKPIANITVSATGTNLTPYLTIAYYGSDEE